MAEKRYFLSAHSLFFTHTLVVVFLAVAGSVTFDSGGGAPTLLGMQARNQAALLLLRSLAASGRLGGCGEKTGQRSKNHSFPLLLLRCPCSLRKAKAGPARSVRPSTCAADLPPPRLSARPPENPNVANFGVC